MGSRGELDPAARVTEIARAAYGRLLAVLAGRSGDLAGAEDALSHAFCRALESWPERGVPANPEGWLLTVARNRTRDDHKSAAARLAVPLDGSGILDAIMPTLDPDDIPDERLKLLFVCAHPAIDPSMRTPLMLQTVLGLEAETISRAFLVPKTAMAQRLVRAKLKIKEARIPFVLPERREMPIRIEAVLEAIYAAFATAWDDPSRPDATADDLGREALFLAELLARLLPDNPEVLGLAALIALTEARRAARRSEEGAYVPLDAQSAERWDWTLLSRGEAWLRAAAARGAMGRFQLEAAIQSAHADRARTDRTDWPAIALLYEGLLLRAPTLGAAIGRAVAVGHAQNATAGLKALDIIVSASKDSYQPYWAARAFLLAKSGRTDEAAEAYRRAIALTEGLSVARYLEQVLAGLCNKLE